MASAEELVKSIKENMALLSKNSGKLSKEDAALLKSAVDSFSEFESAMSEEVEFDKKPAQSKQQIPIDSMSDSEKF